MSRVSAPRPSRIRRVLLALAVAAPVTPVALLATPTAAVADVRPGLRAADAPLLRTESFGYTGQEASFTVPAGVTELTVVATGAPGGILDEARANPITSNGRAARVSGTLTVTPGQVLAVRVGGAGQVPVYRPGGAGGWNGGGAGGTASPTDGSRGGAGGGGATDVRTCAAGEMGCDPLNSRLVVAAGGGGSGAINCGTCSSSIGPVLGGNAGAAGAGYDSSRGLATGGSPGSIGAGGAGGTSTANQFNHVAHGTAGAFGTGGATAGSGGYFGSGGGGGGWYGGGSGATNQYYGAGGGGGSNLVPAGGSSELVARNVAPGLTLSYAVGMLADVSVAVDDNTSLIATGKDTRVVTATATTDTDLPYPGLDLAFSSTDPDHSFSTVVDNGDGTYTATLTGSTSAGTETITATAAGSDPSADVSGMTMAVTENYEMTLTFDDDAPMVATGKDQRIVTATAATVETDRPVRDLDVSFASTDENHTIGAVTDNGDGTYSATLRGGITPGAASVIATAEEGDVAGAELIETEGYSVIVRPVSSRLLATGQATLDVTAEARTESDRAVPGLDLRITSTDPGHVVGAATGVGDGIYVARVTGSTTVGAATLSAVVAGAGEPDVVPTTLHTDPYAVPTLTASVASSTPATNGWYRTPVTVSFACAGTLFAAACPSAVVLSAEGAGQTVSRSIADVIGRSAEVTAGPISIDLTKPTVKVAGAKKGKTYPRPRKLTCKAGDALSGTDTCKVTTKKRVIKKGKKKVGTKMTWTAVATDKAGNTTTTTGSYKVRPRR